MINTYLKDALKRFLKSNQCKIGEKELEILKKELLEDIVVIDRLLAQKITIELVSESEKEDIHYEVKQNGLKLSDSIENRDRAIEFCLKSLR